MSALSGRLAALLSERGFKIACAESCTGGLFAAAIVDVPDASKVFDLGVVAYSNGQKVSRLSVRQEDLEAFGAVSEVVAAAMAENVALMAGADIGIGISGIAGPGGGTKEKPVGTVCFGFYCRGEVFSKTVLFSGGRDEVRCAARDFAISEAVLLLEGK